MDDTVDWAGVRHPVASADFRVACLVPSLTETLFALGLGDHVVARTGFCVHPRERVRRVAKIGGTKDPDLAQLRVLAPTHLVVNVDENRREDVDAARGFVPHVIVTHPGAPDDNRRLLRLLGAVFACGAKAHAFDLDFAAALADSARAVERLPRERVLYLIWRRPWMTVSHDTYVAATLAHVGWDVVHAGAARYPEVDQDSTAWREADRVLLATEPFAFRARDAQALAAEIGKPVALVDGEWTSWYGVRSIEGLRALDAFRVRRATPR